MKRAVRLPKRVKVVGEGWTQIQIDEIQAPIDIQAPDLDLTLTFDLDIDLDPPPPLSNFEIDQSESAILKLNLRRYL